MYTCTYKYKDHELLVTFFASSFLCFLSFVLLVRKCIYICIYVFMYICIYVYMYIYICNTCVFNKDAWLDGWMDGVSFACVWMVA